MFADPVSLQLTNINKPFWTLEAPFILSSTAGGAKSGDRLRFRVQLNDMRLSELVVRCPTMNVEFTCDHLEPLMAEGQVSMLLVVLFLSMFLVILSTQLTIMAENKIG
jgi:hypothetical protein